MRHEFVARPQRGRVVTIERHVGLGDVRPDATVRLDALARFLQDVADEDAASADLAATGVWVLRRLVMRLAHTPRFRADLSLSTWCSGTGARWAERRSDVHFGEKLCVETVAVWVYVDRDRGVPIALPEGFDERWGVSAGSRRIRPTLHHPARPAGTRVQHWPLRVTDLDVVGHVNNAAYWSPAEQELARRDRPRVARAEIEFRAGLDGGEDVDVHTIDTADGFAQWLCVGDDVRASTLVACGPA
jgi:acyl-ACP thioesterase